MTLEEQFSKLLSKREPPKTFCPSEVARALTPAELRTLQFAHWRDAMPAVRALAWQAQSCGHCEILQRGELVDMDLGPEDVRGPIRIRRVGEPSQVAVTQHL